MASGKILLKSNRPWAGYIEWKSTPSPETNTSSLEASCYVYRTDGGQFFVPNPFKGKMWAGTQETSFELYRISAAPDFAGACWVKVPHDSEGHAFLDIGARIRGSDSSDLAGSFLEGRETVALDRILPAGPSKIHFNTASQQMGKQVLISIEPDHPDCRHELRFQFGSRQGILGKKIKTSFSWTVPDLADQCDLEGVCKISCRTFLQKRNLGTTETELTLRVPEPTRPEPEDGSLGTELKLPCPRNSGNFESRLCFILSGQEYAVGEGKEDAFFWTPPYALAKLLPGELQLKGILRCETRNRGSLVGSKEVPLMLAVPENEHTRPRIEGLTLSPCGEAGLEQYGYLRGKTGLQAEFQTASECSEIKDWEIRAGSQEARGNPAVLPILEDGGTLKILATVRDLRGFTASLTREIQVIPYEKPRLIPAGEETKPLCCRAEESGALSPTGTCLLIRAGVLFTALEGKNAPSLSMRIRRGEEPFGDLLDLPLDGACSFDRILPGITLSLKHSYEVELRVRDLLGEETVRSFSILTQAVSFSLYDGVDGAAFGKYPEQPHVLDLAEHMTLRVRGRLELRGEAWMDLGLAEGIQAPSQKVGQAEGAKYRLRGGNQVILAFSCGMPKEHQVINREPLPEGLRLQTTLTDICPSEAGAVLVSLESDGFLRAAPLLGKPDPGWIQGSLQYFK